MNVKLLTEHYLVFLSLQGTCRGSSESTLVKMSNCWKSHAAALKCHPQEDGNQQEDGNNKLYACGKLLYHQLR